MNYLVMEVHPAYAVVLDEEGRFLKAANLRYQVGDTVRDIVELRRPREKRPALWKPLSGVPGLAPCLCLVFFGYYQPNFTPYGALRIQINPDVELTLSRTDRVLELEGLNEDGRVLIEGYDYGGKDREDVTEELVERAIDMGYLSGGETVSITVTSADADWQAREEQAAREDLEERYGETIVIQIGPTDEEPPATEVVIPVTTPSPTPSPSPEPDSTPTPEPDNGLPKVNTGSWELTLVNAQNSIGEAVPEDLAELESGRYFDARAVDALKDFIAGARAEGLSVCLSSAYRSYNEQTYLFNRKVSQCGGDEAAAARIVNRPGTSEHQLGLCADITDKFYEVKTKELEKTALYQWMYAHCQDYGFILRYPADKQDITGVMYEPWHFRYVGKEAAAYIMGNGLCLEEFLDLYK